MITLRVAGVPEHFNLPWHLAIENGAFEKGGLRIEWTDFPGGTGAMNRALRDNETDVAIVLTEGIIADIEKGNPATLCDVYVQSPLIWGIHTGSNSKILDTADLRGKTYAISRPGSGSHLMAIVDRMQRNINDSAVNFAIVNNITGAVDSLNSGESDLFLWEKFTTQPYVDSGLLRRIGKCPTPWPCFVTACHTEFLEKHRAAYQTMIEIVRAEAAKLKTNPEAAAMIARRYGLKPVAAAEWLEAVQWADAPGIPGDMVTNVKRTLLEAGIL